MNIIKAFKNSAMNFAKEEEGAQVIEYALIVAVVSIALVLALSGIDSNFAGFKDRVATCLTNTTPGSCK